MRTNQAVHRVATMCRVLGVSPSGFYGWRWRPLAARAQADAGLSEKIRAIHQRSRGTYGGPRVHAELAAAGIHVGRKRGARLMRAAGLEGVSRRRPGAGFVYLAVVLDVWSGRVVGWALATHLRTELVLGALDMALGQRRPQAVIHHSDQGTQYTSIAFGLRRREAGVRPSMGSVGDADDNAMGESFLATLECERLERRRFKTQIEAQMAVFDFIEGWYNPHRRHSALDYRSPIEFERTFARSVAVPIPRQEGHDALPC